MNGRDDERMLQGCRGCRDSLQDYLDGTLDKSRSLEVFLHLRDCAPCRHEHEALQALYGLLESLPQQPVPDGFDAPVLASVPLASYRAMAELRRDRVPVFLEEETLPAFIRAAGIRLAGLAVAAGSLALLFFGNGPGWLPALAGIAAAPEILVRLQAAGRRVALAVRRAEG